MVIRLRRAPIIIKAFDTLLLQNTNAAKGANKMRGKGSPTKPWSCNGIGMMAGPTRNE